MGLHKTYKIATIRGKWQFDGHKLHAKHYGKILRGMRCYNFLKDDRFKAKRSIFVKTIFFPNFCHIYIGKSALPGFET